MSRVQVDSRLPPTDICKNLNKDLAASAHNQVHISAVKWTVRGNLVITASHSNSEHQLNAALTIIAFFLKNILGFTTATNTTIPIRTNVKWSRLLLNRVPTGITDKHGAYSPDTTRHSNQGHSSSEIKRYSPRGTKEVGQ